MTSARESEPRPALGLMGTIPVFWGEVGGVDDVLAAKSEPHWVRAELEADYQLAPIDYLDSDTLSRFAYIMLAQPRALSGEENVALDAWVRRGGHLLLFADPMMTGHSRFALGDRRRPQDVTLLSPILDHWGLKMDFDPGERPGIAVVEAANLQIPVNLRGHFEQVGEPENCILAADATLAHCAIGKGTATILADAAVLDLHAPDPRAPVALRGLVNLAFGTSGEIAGTMAARPAKE